MRRRELLSSTEISKNGRGMYNNYEYVDLQLTGDAKNLMIATCNVGASAETEYGDYYQYGKGASTYQVTSGESDYSGTENPLALSADTAAQIMGRVWRMPRYKELIAIRSQTTPSGVTINKINFFKISKIVDGKERYALFPLGGRFNGTSAPDSNGTKGTYGCYWSSSNSGTSREAIGYECTHLSFNGWPSKYYRDLGHLVRGVFVKDDTSRRATIDGREYVDLGLPSGLKWATMNVGATFESDEGYYYQYGKGSSQYNTTSGQSAYSGTENPLALSADTARQVMGGSWRMPTKEEFEELKANTSFEETTINGKRVAKFWSLKYSSEDAYLLMPYNAYYREGRIGTLNSVRIWSNTPSGSAKAYDFNASKTYIYMYSENRTDGIPVRGVHT